jgi:hypothetical protein
MALRTTTARVSARYQDEVDMSIFAKKWVIGDNIWSVQIKKGLKADGKAVLGLCLPDEHLIQIDAGQPARERVRTFWHEILHALEVEYGFDLGERENKVSVAIEKLEVAIPKLLRDNYFEMQPIIISQLKDKA